MSTQVPGIKTNADLRKYLQETHGIEKGTVLLALAMLYEVVATYKDQVDKQEIQPLPHPTPTFVNDTYLLAQQVLAVYGIGETDPDLILASLDKKLAEKKAAEKKPDDNNPYSEFMKERGL